MLEMTGLTLLTICLLLPATTFQQQGLFNSPFLGGRGAGGLQLPVNGNSNNNPFRINGNQQPDLNDFRLQSPFLAGPGRDSFGRGNTQDPNAFFVQQDNRLASILGNPNDFGGLGPNQFAVDNNQIINQNAGQSGILDPESYDRFTGRPVIRFDTNLDNGGQTVNNRGNVIGRPQVSNPANFGTIGRDPIPSDRNYFPTSPRDATPRPADILSTPTGQNLVVFRNGTISPNYPIGLNDPYYESEDESTTTSRSTDSDQRQNDNESQIRNQNQGFEQNLYPFFLNTVGNNNPTAGGLPFNNVVQYPLPGNGGGVLIQQGPSGSRFQTSQIGQGNIGDRGFQTFASTQQGLGPGGLQTLLSSQQGLGPNRFQNLANAQQGLGIGAFQDLNSLQQDLGAQGFPNFQQGLGGNGLPAFSLPSQQGLGINGLPTISSLQQGQDAIGLPTLSSVQQFSTPTPGGFLGSSPTSAFGSPFSPQSTIGLPTALPSSPPSLAGLPDLATASRPNPFISTNNNQFDLPTFPPRLPVDNFNNAFNFRPQFGGGASVASTSNPSLFDSNILSGSSLPGSDLPSSFQSQSPLGNNGGSLNIPPLIKPIAVTTSNPLFGLDSGALSGVGNSLGTSSDLLGNSQEPTVEVLAVDRQLGQQNTIGAQQIFPFQNTVRPVQTRFDYLRSSGTAADWNLITMLPVTLSLALAMF